MLDSIRAEFPSLARLSLPVRPHVRPESVLWAVASAAGAAFLVDGILRIALMAVGPLLFPTTEPRPEWLTPAAVVDAGAAIAAAAVAARAGGPSAFALFVATEVGRVLAGVPGRRVFCERGPGGPLQGVQCDMASMLIAQWPLAASLVVGALLAPVLLSRGAAGENRTLRGAGVFSLIVTAASAVVALANGPASTDDQLMVTNLFTMIQVLAGVAAGVVFARAPLAGTVLVALVLVAVPVAYALPLALRPGGVGDLPGEMALLRWAGVYIPGLAAAAIVVSRGYMRRRRGGTFF